MFHQLSKLRRWLLIPVFLLVFALGATLYYYPGEYTPPPSNKPELAEITVPYASVRGFADVLPSRGGTLVVDAAHGNNFVKEEVDALLSRVLNIGYAVELLSDRFSLADKLIEADSFLVIAPRKEYGEDEVTLVEQFVKNGGKLLLVGDPTRPSQINSLTQRFGVLFHPGYLYNVRQHDLNFQNIFVSDFRPDEVTEGLEKIVLYTAGSISTSGEKLALTDRETFSSMIERTEAFAPMVKTSNGRVIAIADLTFLTPPHNVILDNERLIANLANYLTKSERRLFR